MKRLALFAIAVVGTFPVAIRAQEERLSFEKAVESIKATVEPAEARPGQTVTFKVEVRLRENWYTYPTEQLDGPVKSSKTTLQLPTSADLIFVEGIKDPPDYHIKSEGKLSYRTYPGGATWQAKAVVSPKASPGDTTVELKKLTLIVCYEVTGNCLPPRTVSRVATFKVSGSPVPVEAQYQAAVNDTLNPTPPLPKSVGPEPKSPPPPSPKESAKKGPETPFPVKPPAGPDAVPDAVEAEGPSAVKGRLSAGRDHAADLKAVLDQLPPPETEATSFWVFVGTAAFWGFITLLTPCVFPMVPITVSIFLKQSEKQGTNVLALALVYAVTIVVLLSIAAMTLLTTFSRLAVDPITNVLLGALFVVLALSLFGLFEITLPSSVATALDNRAARGGYLGTVFMAASFTVVSFTCVAPFLGGFSGMAASGKFNYAELAAGALAFATAFASPFFLLAVFPSLIKKLPKSGDWMNMVKVTMGFLELAAALKFFRTAELQWLTPPEYFTYDFVLGVWVAILIAMALYLFGMFRTKHDHETHDHVGPWRIMFALTCLGLGVYLLPGLFGSGPKERNRPAGVVYAWVDSFLLPEPSAAEVVGGDLPWSADLKRALDDARGKNGRVFVDFTGVTCTNCKLNEFNVFPKPDVREQFKKYTLVQMYTDTVPAVFYESDPGLTRRKADARHNLQFQKDGFGVEQLPLYVILKPEPNGKTSVVGVYDEGKINKEQAFVEFLKNGLK